MPDLTGWIIRAACLILLLTAELIVLAAVDWKPQLKTTGWLVAPIQYHRAIFAGLIAGGAATTLLGWRTLDEELRQASRGDALHRTSWAWLGLHVVAFACLVKWTWVGIGGGMETSSHGFLWMAVWLMLVILVLLGWSAAVLPPAVWGRWIARSPEAFVAGAAVGIIARIAGSYTQQSWPALAKPTFFVISMLLWLAGQKAAFNYQTGVISTPSFSAYVAPSCSGLEGIGLIAVFLAIYLWFYRSELRFPQAFLLLPIGIATVWLLNAVRVAVLVELGSFQEQLAVGVFHSLAGWLYLSALACAMVVISHRLKFFTRQTAPEKTSALSNPAAVYIVPLLTIIATSMITAAFSKGLSKDFDTLYPIRVIAAAGALALYWKQLGELDWTISWDAVLIGAVTFVVWIGLQRADIPADRAFAAGLSALSAAQKFAWLMFRTAGAVLTVPVAEELAFRGYLIRKLVASEFETVPAGQFTWVSFVASSLLFGLLHQQWIAGTIAGMLFAIALYRRGRICDAVVAHASANAILAAYVLGTHQWSLWN